MVGHRLVHQRLRDEADHRGPGAAFLHRYRPEATGRKSRIDNGGGAGPHRGKHRVGLRIGVKERQRDHVDVVGSQCLVAGIDAGTPQCIGMGPEHALGPRGGARGVLHAEGRERIVRTGGQDRRIGIDGIESVGCRRARSTCVIAVVGGGDRQPAQPFARGRDQRRKARLRDAGNHLGMVGEIAQLTGARAGVGGDCNRAHPGASEPGDDRLGAVVQMHQHPVALANPAGMKACRESGHGVFELGIGPDPACAIEGSPHQVGMIGAQRGLGADQRADVLAGKRIEVLRRKGGGGKAHSVSPVGRVVRRSGRCGV